MLFRFRGTVSSVVGTTGLNISACDRDVRRISPPALCKKADPRQGHCGLGARSSCLRLLEPDGRL
eukprot:13714847-Alexandrium_andersonii.AAC.1